MKLELVINSDNRTFSDLDYPVGDEIARILHRAANQVHGSDMDTLDDLNQPLHDENGSPVGHLRISA